MTVKFSANIYPVTFHVHIGKTEKEILDYCLDNDISVLALEENTNKHSWGWFFYADNSSHGHFYFETLEDTSVITHETFHATIWAMNYIGSTLNSGSEEPWAYLQQYLYKEILKLKDPQQLPGA